LARNRKNQSGAVRFVPALKAVLLCLLIGGSAIGYVLQKNQLYDLGRQIKKREVILERLKWENNLRAAQLANLQMPERLKERARELKLALVPPLSSQVVWLAESPVRGQTNRNSSLLVLVK
jgi:cell division protein FtsB